MKRGDIMRGTQRGTTQRTRTHASGETYSTIAKTYTISNSSFHACGIFFQSRRVCFFITVIASIFCFVSRQFLNERQHFVLDNNRGCVLPYRLFAVQHILTFAATVRSSVRCGTSAVDRVERILNLTRQSRRNVASQFCAQFKKSQA